MKSILAQSKLQRWRGSALAGMRLACWLAALAPLGVRAQSSDFITQPAGTTNCGGLGTYSAYSELHLNFQSWILYWTPDTNSSAYAGPNYSVIYDEGTGPFYGLVLTNALSYPIQIESVNSGSFVFEFLLPNPPGGLVLGTPFEVSVFPPPATVNLSPASQIGCPGSTVTFVAEALYGGSAAELTINWYKNGVLLTNGGRFSTQSYQISGVSQNIISNVLTISNVQASDATFEGGQSAYYCSWTSPGCENRVNSGYAGLTFSGPPTIYEQPASPTVTLLTNSIVQNQPQAVCQAYPSTAADPVTYQWQLQSNGVFYNIPGQTNVALTFADYDLITGFSNGKYARSGTHVYQCEVADSCAVIDSDSVTVTVGPPAISVQPAYTNACEGDPFALSLTAKNTGPDVLYNWYGPQVGSYFTTTNSMLTIANTTTNDYGEWFCVVENGAGFVASSNAWVTVGTAPAITSNPQSVEVPTSGGVAVFQISATGPNLSYSWLSKSGVTVTNGTYPYGTVVKGAATGRLTLSNINANDVFGKYHAAVSNSCGSAKSSDGQLTVTDCPIITQQPVNATNIQGEIGLFSLTAIGAPPPNYQWQVQLTNGIYTNLSDGPGVSGSLSNVLTVSNLTLTQPTNYLCILSNTCGTVVTSSVVSLTVVPVLIQPLLGPGPGTNSIVVPVTPGTAWTASCDASWFHLKVTNGMGSQNLLCTYDVNASLPLGGTLPPRTCTLTLAGIPITVTQAGTLYQPAYGAEFGYVTNRTGMGFNPTGVAVDPSGNVYMVDSTNGGGIWEWTPSNSLNLVLDQVSSTVDGPTAVAADRSGNVYFAQEGGSLGTTEKLYEWNAANNITNTLFSSNDFGAIVGLAVDIPGNVYIAAGYANEILEWSVATRTTTMLIPNLIESPVGMAVDLAGNVYIAFSAIPNQYGQVQIQVWNAATGNLTALVGFDGTGAPGKLIGSQYVTSIAVNGEGGVYFTTTITGDGGALYYLDPVNPAGSYSASDTLIENLETPSGLAVDAADNVFIVDSGLGRQTLFEAPNAYVVPETRNVPGDNGSGSMTAVLPTSANLAGIFTPKSDHPSWLTITGTTNGMVNFAYTANTSASNRVGHITTLGVTSTITQRAPGYVLGTSSLLQGPAAGSNCVVVGLVPPDAIGSYPWTATNNATWLHPAVTSGAGSTNLVFAFDANTNTAPRTGTLTIAGKTLTVTQAGSGYVAAPGPVTTLVNSGLDFPVGIAADGAGNVYIADTDHKAIKVWTPSNQVVTTLVSSNLGRIDGVAVDNTGDIYFSDNGNAAVDEWMQDATNATTVISSGLISPLGITVDSADNLYVVDAGTNAIYEQLAGTTVLNTVVSNLNGTFGVDVDAAGNLYYANNQKIMEWTASDSNVVTLVKSGLSSPEGVAVDGSGNVYIADTVHNAIKEWSALTGSVTTVASGLNWPYGVTVDGAGNLFIADTLNKAIEELPNAYVNSTPVMAGPAAGSGALPAVLPSTANLQGPFAPSSDSSWLNITSVSNGTVNYAVTANPGPYPRTGNLTVLGQVIPVTQYAYPILAGSTLVQGPAAGTSSIVMSCPGSTWTASANASWLHLSAANQSGFGSTNVVFTYDANPGATRTGTLIVGGNTLTVTQAGSAYVPTVSPAVLVGSGLSGPQGMAVDASGHLFIADPVAGVIDEWSPGSSTATPIVSSGLSSPGGVAVDALGDLFIVDSGNNTLKKWVAGSNTLVTLVSSGLNAPSRVALDAFGNAYFTDANNNAVKEWLAASNTVVTLVSSGLNVPRGIAVDAAGNVYIADTGNNAIKEWIAGSGAVITLVSSGLNAPRSLAVDVSGNVYIADSSDNAVKEWIAATGSIVALPLSGLSNPRGVAVDASGNVFVADTSNMAIKELPYAFVDRTPIEIPAGVGFGALPVILPNTQNLVSPYTPVSSRPWLYVGLVFNGQVNFAYPFNAGPTNRTGNITVLGQSISITQAAPPYISTVAKTGSTTFELSSTNLDMSSTYSVLATTNLTSPLSNWTVLGTASNVGGVLQFIDPHATNSARFYMIRSP